MAMQQYVGSSSSSSSNVASLKKYDVFISFRGDDTRKTITSHLYEALNKKVLVFIDDTELQRGDEISSTLIKAIEESDASIVIFSKDYASSKWCLDELVKILECKRDQRQVVIPVFYEIEPSHVRNQTGTYQLAFEKHERDLRHNKDKLQKWKDALTEAANLSGWNSQNYGKESNFIKDIVEDVLKKLNKRHPFEVNKELVGIGEKYEEVEPLLEFWSNDVRTLGLWGMGGIGKTTLAKYLYAKLCSQFDRHCFIENIREESTRSGLKFVRNKLFSSLLELGLDALYVETPIFIRRLALERSLIVLDGVETLEQAENVNIGNNFLGPGSRVIITSRDKQIFSQFDECEIYKVMGLKEYESFELFCLNAFGKKLANDGYEYLSKRAIQYCRGNPLALKVLGAHFRTKSKQVWESELEKLKKIPNGRIYDVLKLSFDDLDPTEKDIFLDIACTPLIPRDSYYYCPPIYSPRAIWDACHFFPESGLEVLRHKALISEKDEMHGLLVEMGKEIVRKESAKAPGRRSRLWDSMEVYDVLKYKMGTEVVEAIEFEPYKLGDLYLSSDCFKGMTNLRYLRIKMVPEISLHLLEGLEWLSDKLRYFYWRSFPLESLPTAFCGEWLVYLIMKKSKLKKLWDGIQRLDNLMILDLAYSKDLIEIPDLSRAPNLQLVNLHNCESLCQLHPSIFSTPKLIELNLNRCTKIESLKTKIHSKSLRKLHLNECSSLVEFSVTSEEMTELVLNGTAVHVFPSSMWNNSKLTTLSLQDCEKLNIVGKKLPNDIGLRFLKDLRLSRSTQINTSNLWFILEGTSSLEKLYMIGCCNLETLPDNIQNNLMLKTLDLSKCSKLESLPNLPASLEILNLIDCGILKSLPKLPASLKTLDLSKCSKLESLPKLPASLQILDLNDCGLFKSLPKLPASLNTLDLDECRKLKSLPKLPSSLENLTATNCIHLDTDSNKHLMLGNMLHRNNPDPKITRSFFCRLAFLPFLPGAQIPREFDFRTTETSIVIPPIPKSGFYCLVYYIILSENIYNLVCTIHDQFGTVDKCFVNLKERKTLLSDHLLIGSYFNSSRLERVGSQNEGDHYNLSFEFKHRESEEKVWSTKGIKGCGVIPVYGFENSLRFYGKSNSRVEIVELQPNAQISDDSDQYSRCSTDEDEENPLKRSKRT